MGIEKYAIRPKQRRKWKPKFIKERRRWVPYAQRIFSHLLLLRTFLLRFRLFSDKNHFSLPQISFKNPSSSSSSSSSCSFNLAIQHHHSSLPQINPTLMVIPLLGSSLNLKPFIILNPWFWFSFFCLFQKQGLAGSPVDEDNRWPPWLKPLLRESFFVQCKFHADSHKSECNMYCLDCMNGALCSLCLAFHKDHRAIQVYFFEVPLNFRLLCSLFLIVSVFFRTD